MQGGQKTDDNLLTIDKQISRPLSRGEAAVRKAN